MSCLLSLFCSSVTADPFPALFLSPLPEVDLWDRRRRAPVTNDLGPRCVYLMGYAREDYARAFFFSRIASGAVQLVLLLFSNKDRFARILNKDPENPRNYLSQTSRRFRFEIPFCCNIKLKRNKEEGESARQDRYSIIRMRSRRGCTVKRYSFGIAG